VGISPQDLTGDDWPDEIAAAARDEFNCTIDITDPNTVTTTDYDPTTDTGGGSTVLTIMTDRPARMQQLHIPQEAITPGVAGKKRDVRFQIDLLPDDPIIRSGFIVRVRSTTRNQKLLRFAFVVNSEINSSHAALTTIETTTDLTVFDPVV